VAGAFLLTWQQGKFTDIYPKVLVHLQRIFFQQYLSFQILLLLP